MLNKNLLRAEMARCGYTNNSLAKEIGISSRTFSNRLNSGDFGAKEIGKMIKCMRLKDPMGIFFAE